MMRSTIIRSPKDFGQLVRASRLQKALTQAQLAQLAGLETKQISRIETTVNEPRLSSALAICAALGLDLWAGAAQSQPGPAPDIADIF